MNSAPNEPKRHPQPAWGARSDLLLRMKVDMTDPRAPEEELPARRTSPATFQICCVPFFVYDLNLGDVVEIRDVDGRNIVSDVVEASGHHTFRAWFQHNSQAVRGEVEAHLHELGCLTEWFDRNLMSVDAPNDTTARTVARYLEECEAARRCRYETGRTVMGDV